MRESRGNGSPMAGQCRFCREYPQDDDVAVRHLSGQVICLRCAGSRPQLDPFWRSAVAAVLNAIEEKRVYALGMEYTENKVFE